VLTENSVAAGRFFSSVCGKKVAPANAKAVAAPVRRPAQTFFYSHFKTSRDLFSPVVSNNLLSPRKSAEKSLSAHSYIILPTLKSTQWDLAKNLHKSNKNVCLAILSESIRQFKLLFPPKRSAAEKKHCVRIKINTRAHTHPP
jgi:hypothetical protein